VSVRSIQKNNGKVIYETDKVPSNMNFHGFNVDARAGKAELIGFQMKITHHLNGDVANR
jgi:hypothetical protein